jgi:hypothetical protein
LDALQEYYENAKIPRCRNKKSAEIKSGEAKLAEAELSDDSESSVEECLNVEFEIFDDIEEDMKGNPAGRVRFMKTALEESNIIKTEFNLLVSYCCLKPGHEFLVIFQGKNIKIHLLYAAYERFLKEVLVDICETGSLKDSKGNDLTGKELKNLKLENKLERRQRKSEGSRKAVEKTVRYGRLVEDSACLLNKEIQEGIRVLCEKYKLSKKKEEELITEAKSKCFKFQVQLAKSLQHYLPLDRDFLRWLKYLCPKKFLKTDDSEAYIIKIAECFPNIKKEELDDLRREVRKLKVFQKDYFGENLDYMKNVCDGFKKVKDEEEVVSIAEIWKPIINNEDTPVMRKFLMSSLSIFHGTASVEGSVNVTRNLLGDRSHRLTNINLESKKMVKSAVCEAPSNCCYDFDVDGPAYHSDWMKARALWRKDGKKEEDLEQPQLDNQSQTKPRAGSENVIGSKGDIEDRTKKINKNGVNEDMEEVKQMGASSHKVKDKETGRRGKKRKNTSAEKGQSKMTSFVEYLNQNRNKQ